MTERAQIITSQGVQIHGGMGFIEETGAAQHYRDSRILTIYEGTTAIQANDLVFRKTVRDNGVALNQLLNEIDGDMELIQSHENPRVSKMSSAVRNSLEKARAASEHILRCANDPRRPATSANNYLMLLGTLCGGWMMVRSASAAADAIKKTSNGKENFMNCKITTAEICVTQHLPQVIALAKTILDGEEPILSMMPEWL